MQPAHDTVLRIGSQDLVPFGDSYRFVIQEVMPHKDFMFKFSVRDRILKEVLNRGKRLEVTFKEFPTLALRTTPFNGCSKAHTPSK